MRCNILEPLKGVVTVLSFADLSRFKREEAKIQAWENHEKAKAEAEMRRVEVRGSHLDLWAAVLTLSRTVVAVFVRSSGLCKRKGVNKIRNETCIVSY